MFLYLFFVRSSKNADSHDRLHDGGFAVVYSYAGSPNVVAVLNPQAVSFRGTIPVHSLMQPGTHWQDWISGGVFTVTPSGLVIAVPPVPAGKCGRTSVCGLMILENVTGDVASSACREPTAQKQRALDDVMIVRSRKFPSIGKRKTTARDETARTKPWRSGTRFDTAEPSLWWELQMQDFWSSRPVVRKGNDIDR
jgi:hypothetical protein